MIKAEVEFEDDYILLNGKHVWLHGDSQNFAVGQMDEDHEDGGEVEELLPSLELAIIYCLEQTNDLY